MFSGKVMVAPACLKSEIAVIWQAKIFSDVPKGLRLPAQGCRFGYPGKLVRKEISTATRLRRFQEKCTKQTQPRCG
jgi:hypothetical protein